LIDYFKSYSSLGDDRFFCVTLYLKMLKVSLYALKDFIIFVRILQSAL